MENLKINDVIENKIETEQNEITNKNVEIIDKSGIANMYLGYYQLPSLNDSPNRGSVTLLGTDASTKYYLLVSNNGKSNVSN